MVDGNNTVEGITKRVRRECNSYPLPDNAAAMLRLVREVEVAHRHEILVERNLVDEYLAAKDAEIAELRECLKDACNTELSCRECKSPCYVYTQDDCPIKKRWRKALEGGTL